VVIRDLNQGVGFFKVAHLVRSFCCGLKLICSCKVSLVAELDWRGQHSSSCPTKCSGKLRPK
jgi:hypothetical protein